MCLQNYEWLFVPWLVYHAIYSLVTILSPTIITYLGFSSMTDAPNDKSKILTGLVPILVGLLTIYLWIHVKMLFDQLTKAGRVKPAPAQPPPPKKENSNVTIAVMAPYPPYDKNYSIYDNAGYVSPNAAVISKNAVPLSVQPTTPQVVPPTPVKKDQ